jgi:hypothetical protein
MDTTRISMLHIDDQVREFREANPLPPIPVAVAQEAQDVDTPEMPAPAEPVDSALPQTGPPPAAPPVYTLASDVPTDPILRRPAGFPTGLWVWVAAVVAIMLVLAVLFIVAVFGDGSNDPEDPIAEEGATLGQLAEAQATEPGEVTALANATVGQSNDITEPPTAMTIVVNPTLAVAVATQAVATQPPATVPVSTLPAPDQSIATQPNTSGMGGQAAIGARGWDLLLLAEGEDSLFVINQSASGMAAFPLTLMQFSQDGETVLRGNAWRVANLESGQCVMAAKNDKARTPDTNCERVGEVVRTSGNERFWKRDFDNFTVTFNNGAWRVICPTDQVRSDGCPVFIPSSTAG